MPERKNGARISIRVVIGRTEEGNRGALKAARVVKGHDVKVARRTAVVFGTVWACARPAKEGITQGSSATCTPLGARI